MIKTGGAKTPIIVVRQQQDSSSPPSENIEEGPPQSTFLLPVFPLSKRVKFPTERLKLTLWEERYKALARYVLDRHAPRLLLAVDDDDAVPIFGALYSSHKAQIVRGGNGPITPVVEPNDVGILCCVTSSQVFVRGEEVELDRKDDKDVEKIRLWGLGVARFRVVKVLSSGYNNSNKDEIDQNDGDGQSLPFILVEAVFQKDNFITGDNDDILHLDQRLQELLRRLDVTSRDEILLGLEECNQYGCFQQTDEKKRRLEMLSLALTSRLEPSAPAMEMLEMLRTCSTKERVEYLERKLPSGQSNISWMKDKFRMFFQ
jgi:Uncharacterized protein, similar to the N-terminal domain of Lon protease